MSAHVLLNLLNEPRNIDKMRGLPSILSLFSTKFNKFNNTGVRLLDKIAFFGVKTSRSCHLKITQCKNGHHKSANHLGVRPNCIQNFHLGRYIVGGAVKCEQTVT